MSDDHYYIAGYSAEDDPYSEANGVLKNKLGITNTKDLNEVEAELAALAVQELLQRKPPAEYSVDSLQAIHREIFQDIYPWAGEFRKVDIAKGDTYFEKHQDIAGKLNSLFEGCKSKDYFKGLPAEEFAQESANFLIQLNLIHPFREGNGRSQRLLLSQMALNAGYKIEWSGVSDSAMKKACIDGAEGNGTTMKKMLKLYLEPIPPEPQVEAKALVMENKEKMREKYLVGKKSHKKEP